MRHGSRALLWLACGALVTLVGWAALAAAELAPPGPAHGGVTPAAALLVTLLMAAVFGAFASDEVLRRRLAQAAENARPAELVVLIGAWVVLAVAFGSHLISEPPAALKLEGELNLVAISSSLLLFTAGVVAWLIADGAPHGTPARRAARALALFLVYMALDEAIQLHERLERLVDIAWPVLFIPVMLAAGFVWLLAIRTFVRPRRALVLFVAAAPLWLASPVLEQLEFSDPLKHHDWSEHFYLFSGMEEPFELAGAACFLLALLACFQYGRGRRPAPARLNVLGVAFVIAGAGLAVGSIGMALLDGGYPGFGTKQELGVAVAAVLMAGGAILLAAHGRRHRLSAGQTA